MMSRRSIHKTMHLHIDADILVYRCGFAAERMHYYLTIPSEDITLDFESKAELDEYLEYASSWLGEGDYEVEKRRLVEPVANAQNTVKTTVGGIVSAWDNAVKISGITMYLSGEDNYRNDIATIKPYKGNRDPNNKPTHALAIKEYIKEKWDTDVSTDEEADDVMGYSHTVMYTEDKDSSCICTTDKDLNMIPGWHYNLTNKNTFYMTPEKAMEFFWTQLITGDTTDNVAGVPGAGAKAAEVAYADAETQQDYYQAALALYVQRYDNPDAALLENGRLLWIRREPEQLWEPPNENQEG
jgi:hypothetical protein